MFLVMAMDGMRQVPRYRYLGYIVLAIIVGLGIEQWFVDSFLITTLCLFVAVLTMDFVYLQRQKKQELADD